MRFKRAGAQTGSRGNSGNTPAQLRFTCNNSLSKTRPAELKVGFYASVLEERARPPVTVCGTGQRSNQLNYVPNRGINNLA